jgi:ankyrin repeat protein
MPTPKLHDFVRKGDLVRVKEILDQPSAEQEVNAYDDRGLTPLMHAVIGSNISTDMIRLLLDYGADINKQTVRDAPPTTAMALALGAGNPNIVALLIERGGKSVSKCQVKK